MVTGSAVATLKTLLAADAPLRVMALLVELNINSFWERVEQFTTASPRSNDFGTIESAVAGAAAASRCICLQPSAPFSHSPALPSDVVTVTKLSLGDQAPTLCGWKVA